MVSGQPGRELRKIHEDVLEGGGGRRRITAKNLSQRRYIELMARARRRVRGRARRAPARPTSRWRWRSRRCSGTRSSRVILDAARGRGGREARLPARQPRREGEPLPAAALRRAPRHDGLRQGARADRARRDRGGAARLHARPHAERLLRDPRRGAEHDRRADEDVPDAPRLRLEGGGHGRRHADRPAERQAQRADRGARASSTASRASASCASPRPTWCAIRSCSRSSAPTSARDARARPRRRPERAATNDACASGPAARRAAGSRAGPPAARGAARARCSRRSASRGAELSLALVDDADDRRAERSASAASAAPTDVLSFSLVEGAHARAARRAARRRRDGRRAWRGGRRARAGRTLDDELARLLIHGVLHLLGHDHERGRRRPRACARRSGALWRALAGVTRTASRAAGSAPTPSLTFLAFPHPVGERVIDLGTPLAFLRRRRCCFLARARPRAARAPRRAASRRARRARARAPLDLRRDGDLRPRAAPASASSRRCARGLPGALRGAARRRERLARGARAARRARSCSPRSGPRSSTLRSFALTGFPWATLGYALHAERLAARRSRPGRGVYALSLRGRARRPRRSGAAPRARPRARRALAARGRRAALHAAGALARAGRPSRAGAAPRRRAPGQHRPGREVVARVGASGRSRSTRS